MQRALGDYEHEIANQILIIELCFGVCKEIPIKSEMGSHFNCYLFNLNMSKGIASLHSLLKPAKDEISLKNYLSLFKSDLNKRKGCETFLNKIKQVENKFTKTATNMRHKVVSHLDPYFKHSDFTSGYLLPNRLDDFIDLTIDLKKVFYKFSNFAMENSCNVIKKQVKTALKAVNDN